MKRKYSIFINIATLVLCVCAIAIGVYSAKTASLSVSGTIGLNAHDCDVKVSGYIYGHSRTIDGEPIAKPTAENGVAKDYLKYGTSYTSATEGNPLVINKDNNNSGELTFNQKTGEVVSGIYFSDLTSTGDVSPIKIVLTITNISDFDITYEDITTVEKTAQYTVSCDNNFGCLSTSGTNQTTLTYTIQLKKGDDGEYANIVSSITIPLNLKFSKINTKINSTNFVISNNSITGVPPRTPVSDTLVIPSKFADDATTYTTLGSGSKITNIDTYKKVIILDGFKTISASAFMNCYNITKIAILNSVTSIGDTAFGYCSRLTSINFGENSQLTSIGNCAFQGCGLTSITIPAGVTSIGYQTFNSCGLTSINFGENSQLTSIDSEAFSYCGLTSITIPEGVTSIGNRAFEGCGLTSINFGENPQLTYIGYYAFQDCSRLTSITIPEGVTDIGDYAFSYCGLTSITIPEGVTSIGNFAFYGCSGLTSVTFEKATPPKFGYNIFDNCSALESIYVPDGSVDDYKNAENFSDYASIIKPVSEKPV